MLRAFAIVLLASCVKTSYVYSPSFARGPAPKPAGCPIDVMSTQPDKNFEEVGTLAFYNGTEPVTLDGFKKVVADQVCEVGGDAVIAVANEKGQYTKATVVRYVR